tara:strand:+ start:698 stop:886 length:189 start_codon:yes stop_codon:yes gene_type:complete
MEKIMYQSQSDTYGRLLRIVKRNNRMIARFRREGASEAELREIIDESTDIVEAMDMFEYSPF